MMLVSAQSLLRNKNKYIKSAYQLELEERRELWKSIKEYFFEDYDYRESIIEDLLENNSVSYELSILNRVSIPDFEAFINSKKTVNIFKRLGYELSITKEYRTEVNLADPFGISWTNNNSLDVPTEKRTVEVKYITLKIIDESIIFMNL